MSSRQLRVLVAGVTAFALCACQGPVTEEDLDLWTRNDIGLKRIEEVVTDRAQPIETRVRALEVVVEKGLLHKIRGLIDAIWMAQATAANTAGLEAAKKELVADRELVIERLTVELLEHVDTNSDKAVNAKDTLMLMQRYMTDVQFETAREHVAKWAFGAVDWSSPAKAVEESVQGRILSGQIVDLGKHGLEPAALLISHGFLVDRMLEYLSASKAEGTRQLLLRGLKKYQQREGAQDHHIEAIAETELPEAAAYLFEVYLNEKNDQDIRTAAFNAATTLLEKEAIKKSPDVVAEVLLKLMDREDREDKWLGAVNLVTLDGAKHLAPLLEKFAVSDITMLQAKTQDDEDPAKSVIDFCDDLYEAGAGVRSAAEPALRKALTHQHKVVRSIAIICLKAIGAFEADEDLAKVAALMATPETDVSIDDFLGEQLTLGRLATNAIDGLKMIKAMLADKLDNKLNDTELRFKRLAILIELAKVGDDYRTTVESGFAGWKVEYDKNPAKFDDAGGEAEKPPEGADTPPEDGEKPAATDKKGDDPKPSADDKAAEGDKAPAPDTAAKDGQ